MFQRQGCRINRVSTEPDDAIPMMNASHDWTTDDLEYYGDPTKPSAEKGEKLYKAIVDNSVEFIDDLREFREKQC